MNPTELQLLIRAEIQLHEVQKRLAQLEADRLSEADAWYMKLQRFLQRFFK